MFHQGFHAKHLKTITTLDLRPRASSVSRCLEPLIKHSHSFLTCYLKCRHGDRQRFEGKIFQAPRVRQSFLTGGVLARGKGGVHFSPVYVPWVYAPSGFPVRWNTPLVFFIGGSPSIIINYYVFPVHSPRAPPCVFPFVTQVVLSCIPWVPVPFPCVPLYANPRVPPLVLSGFLAFHV